MALSIGIAVPLTLVGLTVLWGMWRESRRQLNHSVEEQAELAAVAFERWIDGQRQPLTTLAAIAAQHPPPPLAASLPFIVNTRPYWIDLQVLDAAGNAFVTQPKNAQPLPAELAGTLRDEMRRRNSWAVVTDWTRGEGRPIIAIATPVEGGGAIIARVDGSALGELFRNIELSDESIIAVFDSQRRVLYRSSTEKTYYGTDRSGSPLFVPLNNQPKAVVEAVSPYDGVRRIYGLVRVGSTDCVVAIGAASATLYKPARWELTRYLLFSLLALLCAVAAALIITRSIALPVSRLRDAARRFGAGDLTARAAVGGSDEMADLGTAFNDMAEQIEKRTMRLAELDRLKSEFVGGVSHELRTPLTTIKTLTRVMLRGGETEAERHEYLETIAAECDRQIDLVLNLLDLSRIEAGAFTISRSRVDVTEVAQACMLIERHTAEARAQDLRAELPAQLPPVLADSSALRRVICGLIENAIKYTPEFGRITLSARRVGDEVAISIADTGCGIRTEDIPYIFEKFYRGRPAVTSLNDSPDNDSSPGAEAPGVGLGLYLARTIIEQAGGRINVESVARHGSIFTLYLPVYHGGRAMSEEEGHAETATRSR